MTSRSPATSHTPPSSPSNRRFDGPFHASQIVDFATGCGYAWKLREVEGAPEAFRHAKALLGDVVHYLLEAFHLNALPLDPKSSPDPAGVWLQMIETAWQRLVLDGNPRYPDRAHLPMYYGRVRIPGGSRAMEAQEFTDKWFPAAVQWLSEYAIQPYNQENELTKTLMVETSYRLMLQDKGSKAVYTVVGRLDFIRVHSSMKTVPRSLYDQDKLRPGIIEELQARLVAHGQLIELGDWKSGKDKPVYASQRDPYVVMTKTFQPRLYALAMAEGEMGELQRTVGADGRVLETFEPAGPFGVQADFYSWHHLPGYERRKRGERQPQHKGARFKAGTEPRDLYIPGMAPGDYMDSDPRAAVLVRPIDLESIRKDARRVIAGIRLGQFWRAPGRMTCTACRFVRECEADLDVPIIDEKALGGLDFDDFDEDDYGLEGQ